MPNIYQLFIATSMMWVSKPCGREIRHFNAPEHKLCRAKTVAASSAVRNDAWSLWNIRAICCVCHYTFMLIAVALGLASIKIARMVFSYSKPPPTPTPFIYGSIANWMAGENRESGTFVTPNTLPPLPQHPQNTKWLSFGVTAGVGAVGWLLMLIQRMLHVSST